MTSLPNDLCLTFRLLRRRPAFAAVVLLTLAVSIGANSTMFSVVNAVLLQALPYPDSTNLVQLFFALPKDDVLVKFLGTERVDFPWADFEDIRSQQQVCDGLAAYRPMDTNFRSDQGPERLVGADVSSGFFSLLGINPLLGRGFQQTDSISSNSRTVVLSHSLWQRHFAGTPEVIGKSVLLDGSPYTVAGVMPASFSSIPTKDWSVRSGLIRSHLEPELWIRHVPSPDDQDRSSMQFNVIARLKSGITAERAQADLNVIARRLGQQYPHCTKDWGIAVEPLHKALRGRYRTLLSILQGAAGLVLLIASINLANLLLSRSAGRKAELAIRTSLGANRVRILRQLLTESLVLSMLGGGTGLLLTYEGIQLLNNFLPAIFVGIPLIRVDTQVFGFTLLISLLAGAGFGLAPAIQSSRVDLNSELRQSQMRATRSGRNRLSRLLIVAQVSLTLSLLIAAGLLVKAFYHLWHINPGCRIDNVLTMRLNYTVEGTPGEQTLRNYFRRVLDRMNAMPGVESAGLVGVVPTAGSPYNSYISLMGRPDLQNNRVLVSYQPASSQYFRTMGIPLRQGRYFTDLDDENAPLVALIGETMAERFWPGQNPVGKQVHLDGKPRTVLGVVGDVRQEDLSRAYRCSMYLPYPQYLTSSMTVVVRTANPQALIDSVRKSIYAIDAGHPVSHVRTMETVVADGLISLRLIMFLLLMMAGLALILALLGIYGVLSNLVTQRRREIGVRMALGARRWDVLKMVLQQGLSPVLLGIGAGIMLSLGITRILSNQLYGVTPTDPATFALVSMLMIAAASLACVIPAGKAAHVDPLVTLKCD